MFSWRFLQAMDADRRRFNPPSSSVCLSVLLSSFGQFQGLFNWYTHVLVPVANCFLTVVFLYCYWLWGIFHWSDWRCIFHICRILIFFFNVTVTMSKIIVVSFSCISKESQVMPTFFEINLYIHPHEEKLKSI